MKKWVELEFEVGDMVYLKTDQDQHKRIITGICLRQAGILYELAQGTTSSWHYVFELSATIDVVVKTSDK